MPSGSVADPGIALGLHSPGRRIGLNSSCLGPDHSPMIPAKAQRFARLPGRLTAQRSGHTVQLREKGRLFSLCSSRRHAGRRRGRREDPQPHHRGAHLYSVRHALHRRRRARLHRPVSCQRSVGRSPFAGRTTRLSGFRCWNRLVHTPGRSIMLGRWGRTSISIKDVKVLPKPCSQRRFRQSAEGVRKSLHVCPGRQSERAGRLQERGV